MVEKRGRKCGVWCAGNCCIAFEHRKKMNVRCVGRALKKNEKMKKYIKLGSEIRDLVPASAVNVDESKKR